MCELAFKRPGFPGGCTKNGNGLAFSSDGQLPLVRRKFRAAPPPPPPRRNMLSSRSWVKILNSYMLCGSHRARNMGDWCQDAICKMLRNRDLLPTAWQAPIPEQKAGSPPAPYGPRHCNAGGATLCFAPAQAASGGERPSPRPAPAVCRQSPGFPDFLGSCLGLNPAAGKGQPAQLNAAYRADMPAASSAEIIANQRRLYRHEHELLMTRRRKNGSTRHGWARKVRLCSCEGGLTMMQGRMVLSTSKSRLLSGRHGDQPDHLDTPGGWQLCGARARIRHPMMAQSWSTHI